MHFKKLGIRLLSTDRAKVIDLTFSSDDVHSKVFSRLHYANKQVLIWIAISVNGRRMRKTCTKAILVQYKSTLGLSKRQEQDQICWQCQIQLVRDSRHYWVWGFSLWFSSFHMQWVSSLFSLEYTIGVLFGVFPSKLLS